MSRNTRDAWCFSLGGSAVAASCEDSILFGVIHFTISFPLILGLFWACDRVLPRIKL